MNRQLTFVSALGCGLIAGVFFAFWAFMLPAFAQVPASTGIAAMQAINVAYVLAGAGFYIVGVIVVTSAFNVPLNDSRAKLLPQSSGAETQWTSYVTRWGWWNFARMWAALAASASLIIGLCRIPVRTI